MPFVSHREGPHDSSGPIEFRFETFLVFYEDGEGGRSPQPRVESRLVRCVLVAMHHKQEQANVRGFPSGVLLHASQHRRATGDFASRTGLGFVQLTGDSFDTQSAFKRSGEWGIRRVKTRLRTLL